MEDLAADKGRSRMWLGFRDSVCPPYIAGGSPWTTSQSGTIGGDARQTIGFPKRTVRHEYASHGAT